MNTSTPSGSEAATHEVEDLLQPIPESARTTKLSGQFWIWAGANVAPINWILGALGIHLGLGFADTVTVLILGNLIGMLGFGCFVILGQKTGATGMLLSRGAFGRRGAYLPAAIQATIAIAAFERWTMPPTVLVLIAMSIVAWTQLDINWAYQGPPGEILTGMPRIAAMSTVMTAIGIGWGIGWFTYAPDCSRFVSRKIPPIKLYPASVLGQFLPVVWLGILGASLATKNGSADPGQLIVQSYGAFAIPVILLVIHGPIATNIINLYTFGVASQALDIQVSRRKLTIAVGFLSMLAVIGFMFAHDFAELLHTWLIAIVAWVATWGGIMAVHYSVFERHHRDFSYLFLPPRDTHLRSLNPVAYVAFFAGILMTWLCMYGSVPALQGPIARAVGGVDFSWPAGTVTSATIYFVFSYRRFRSRLEAGIPLVLRQGLDDQDVLEKHGSAVTGPILVPMTPHNPAEAAGRTAPGAIPVLDESLPAPSRPAEHRTMV